MVFSKYKLKKKKKKELTSREGADSPSVVYI